MDTTAELNTEESSSSDAAMAADNAPPESTGAEVGQAPAPSVSEPDASHEPEATAKGGEAVPAEPASPKLDLISFFPASERAPRIEAAPPKAPRNFVAPGLVAPRSALSPRRRRGLRANASIGSLGREGPAKRALGLDRFKPDGTSGCDRGRARPRGDRRRAKASRRDETGGLRDARRQRRGFATHRPGSITSSATRAPVWTSSPNASTTTRRRALRISQLGSTNWKRRPPRRLSPRSPRTTTRRRALRISRLGSTNWKRRPPRRAVAVVAPDHDASPRFADLAARLDKLEKKAASPTLAAVAPAPPPKPIADSGESRPHRFERNDRVHRETEASAARLRRHRRRRWIRHDRGREGAISVGPGDMIPGLGRVLRIERHGREWLVVTSVGVIAGEAGPY